MSEKRDIQADRVMIEKHLGWAETGSWARYFADIASHYLTRTEEAESALSHERRKVDAAIEELRYRLRYRPCPEREKARTRACEDAKYAHLKSYDALCPKCWSDYLDQKAKESEGK